MKDLIPTIEKIEALLAQGTCQHATYAALECRLAIERVCYERLKVAHAYISHEDLQRWQPQHVVRTLIAEVDGNIANSFTLFMSPTPVDSSAPPDTRKGYEAIDDWVEVGRQAGFDPQHLGSLWHSLSNIALHVRLPKSEHDPLPQYGDQEGIRKKVQETLVELRKLAAGTMLSSGLGPEVSFPCSCGRINKRRASLLQDGQTVSCVGFDCPETYRVTISDTGIGFCSGNFRYV